jgi:hypothetical protein
LGTEYLFLCAGPPKAPAGGDDSYPGAGKSATAPGGSILGGAAGVSAEAAPIPATATGGTEDEGADPKVQEFMKCVPLIACMHIYTDEFAVNMTRLCRVLDEYRVKCEAEGNYDEAGRAAEQLTNIRRQASASRHTCLFDIYAGLIMLLFAGREQKN